MEWIIRSSVKQESLDTYFFFQPKSRHKAPTFYDIILFYLSEYINSLADIYLFFRFSKENKGIQ